MYHSHCFIQKYEIGLWVLAEYNGEFSYCVWRGVGRHGRGGGHWGWCGYGVIGVVWVGVVSMLRRPMSQKANFSWAVCNQVYLLTFHVCFSRVLYLEKCKWWGDWDVEFDVLLDDIIGVPAIHGNRMAFKVKKVG